LSVLAQDAFPKGPVKIIVPFPPGGPTDILARQIAMRLQERWGQTVLLDFKPGAGTVIGVDAVAKSAPDGQTLGMVNTSLAINPSLRKKLPYDPKDVVGVTQLAALQLALVARPDAPFSTVRELIDFAKRNPGKVTYASPGAGSTPHLGGELLKREGGFDMLHVAMKGSAPAYVELMAGRVDLFIDPLFAVLPYTQSGKLKMIATLGDKRVRGHDQIPTVGETLNGFAVGAMLGLIAPAQTPRPVIQRIQADVAAVLLEPAIRGAAGRARHDGGRIHASAIRQLHRCGDDEVATRHRRSKDRGRLNQETTHDPRIEAPASRLCRASLGP
jgi:tripartite-type tricarboxylate transporter receptor subunit TctC